MTVDSEDIARLRSLCVQAQIRRRKCVYCGEIDKGIHTQLRRASLGMWNLTLEGESAILFFFSGNALRTGLSFVGALRPSIVGAEIVGYVYT